MIHDAHPPTSGRRSAGVLVFLLLLVLAITAATTLSAPATTATEEPWESVLVIYHSDVGGKIEPCG